MFNFLIIFSTITVSLSLSEDILIDTNTGYLVSNIQTDFLHAYITCKQYGYQLAVENSKEESDKINEAITKAGTGDKIHFFGGIYQQNPAFLEKQLLWFENLKPIQNYTNWLNDQPSQTYDCLFRYAVIKYQGKWGTVDCAAQHNFICTSNRY